MIKDKDSIVVTNTLNVLNEILKKEGGISISSKMIIHLLNNLKEFNEWGQNVVLEIVSRYTPKDEEQLYAILVYNLYYLYFSYILLFLILFLLCRIFWKIN